MSAPGGAIVNPLIAPTRNCHPARHTVTGFANLTSISVRGIVCTGGIVRALGAQATVLLTDSRIESCHAEQTAGAVYCAIGRLVVRNASISNCTAGTSGGGAHIEGGVVTFTDCAFSFCAAPV